MSDETLFYVLGIALVCVALILSAVGIRDERFPGSPRLLAAVAVLVAALVGATTVFAVRNAVDEEQHREAELASDEARAEEEQPAPEQPAPQAPAGGEEEQGGGAQPAPTAQGPGGTVALAADPAAIAYDKKRLTSKPGEVTIDFTNPSPIEHDVVISEGSTIVAKTDLISDSETSASANLGPGSYTFYCSVPGHREAGMEGTLSVK
jgi:plastocyanin